MRITQPGNTQFQAQDGNRLVFVSDGGERHGVTVLEPDLVRVQHWADGRSRLDRTWMIVDAAGQMPHTGRPRDDLSPFSLPPIDVRRSAQAVTVQTGPLQAVLHMGKFGIAWRDENGRVFASDQLDRAYPYDQQSGAVYHYLVRRPDEHYFGFGEKAGELDKYGRRLRLFSLDALGYNARTSDPLYKHFPFYITLVPELNIAYGLLYDNLSTSVFDLGSEIDNYYEPFRSYRADAGDIDYYLIYGPTVAEVVQKLARLTGYMALPPRWSLGFCMSAFTPTEQPDAQAQLAQMVAEFAAHDVPCSIYQLSSGYSVMQEGQATSGTDVRQSPRYVFYWNRSRVPDPQAMSADFHRAGIRLAANIKPALPTTHPQYDEVAAQQGFIQAAEADVPYTSQFWGGDGAHLDFTNPVAYGWWQQQVTQSLLQNGIDSTWNDNNEYTLWDDAARCYGFGKEIAAGQIRPLHALLMTQASYEAQQAFRPDERPFAICRSGTVGIQRYAQTWSGDNETSWETLRYNIPMGLGMSLSNAPSYGHDVGGFVGRQPDAELLVRWVQNGIFHPRFTMHSWAEDASYTAPWLYPETADLLRDLFRFRYRLIPYLYTLFFEASRTGAPMIRPLVYQFQHDPQVHTESFDFMLGPNLLVASVLEPGARQRTVYLPRLSAADAGLWCDFHTGDWYAGGQTVNVDAPLARIPLFVPAGGIIPLGDVLTYVPGTAVADASRELRIFAHPDGGTSRFTLIEDDGISHAYRDGGFTEVVLTAVATASRVEVGISYGQRGFELPYGEVDVVLPVGDGRSVVLSKK